MNANKRELIFKDEVFRIIGAAMEVSNHLGSGFLEAVYQEALGIEFTERRIRHEAQKRIKISYKDTVLNKGNCDLSGVMRTLWPTELIARNLHACTAIPGAWQRG